MKERPTKGVGIRKNQFGFRKGTSINTANVSLKTAPEEKFKVNNGHGVCIPGNGLFENRLETFMTVASRGLRQDFPNSRSCCDIIYPEYSTGK